MSLTLTWAGVFESGTPPGFAQTILTTVAVTTAVWLTATCATAPEPRSVLQSFYNRVRPAGPGWQAFAGGGGAASGPPEPLAPNFLNWILGIVVVYSTLFAIGDLLFGYVVRGLGLTALAVLGGIALARRL